MKALFQRAVVGMAVTASILAPTIASAACTSADLKGGWRIYITDYTYNGTCPARFNILGNVVAVTTCRTIDSAVVEQLEEGRLRLRSAATCLFNGVLKIGGENNIIKSFTLSMDKTTGFGVGTNDNGPFEVEFTKIAN
jgi:hypothetical protein